MNTTRLIENTFYRDDINKNVTSISFGTVWMCFYREALVAITHVTDKGIVEAVMVKSGKQIPIAYSSYHAWLQQWKIEGEKIARDFGISLDQFEGTTPVDIQAIGVRWIGDNIASIVGDRLTADG